MSKPDIVLKKIITQHGITILAQSRLKGLILDLMPTAERKYINVMRRAIDEQIGVKLLEMQHDDPAVRQIKINILKEKFKNDNAFDDTALYIVDCFIHALGWNNPAPEIILPFKEIKISNQIWADRNLDVSHFRNGDPIPHAMSDEEWRKAGDNEQPAWCYYYNDPENGKIFGKLYNWYAVNDLRGLAPNGWHVPSDLDWEVLSKYLGGPEKAGAKLKSINYWKENGNGADIFGFSALPGGYRGGSFFSLEYNGLWWTSSMRDTYDAWSRYMYFNFNTVHRSYVINDYGLSVRCIKK